MFAGIVMVAFSIGYSLVKLQELRAEIGQKMEVSAGLESEIRMLDERIDQIRNGPITELITPRAAAVEVEGLRDWITGRQLYNIMLWVEMPYYRRSGIRYINYNFDHPSKLMRDRQGRVASNGFAVSYLGWGCLEVVELTIVQADRSEAVYHFPLCDIVEMPEQKGEVMLEKK